MRWRILALAAAGTAMCTVASALPANAAATDVGAFTSNLQDYQAALNYDTSGAGGGGDNITCDAPTVSGAALVQATNLVVGEVFGEDAAVAHEECATLTPSATYTLYGQLTIQAYENGAWVDVAWGPWGSTSSSASGATVLTLRATGIYAPPTPALGAYHRAYVHFYTSTGRAPESPSPSVWYMNN